MSTHSKGTYVAFRSGRNKPSRKKLAAQARMAEEPEDLQQCLDCVNVRCTYQFQGTGRITTKACWSRVDAAEQKRREELTAEMKRLCDEDFPGEGSTITEWNGVDGGYDPAIGKCRTSEE